MVNVVTGERLQWTANDTAGGLVRCGRPGAPEQAAVAPRRLDGGGYTSAFQDLDATRLVWA
jgi:hypothetical protein